MSESGVFEQTIEYPDDRAAERYNRLVGIDDAKSRLLKEAGIRLDPHRVHEWSKKHHSGVVAAATALLERPPVFILAGDVGTGKTALAESFGHAVAKSTGRQIFAYRMSLAARGSGLVGESTTKIQQAFSEIINEARKRKTTAGFILIIDEADALAQSRESAQMHHEDRAAVNALIRGINAINEDSLPCVVVLCTNRLSAIDPAVQRRSAEPFIFDRPDEEQRRAVFETLLEGISVKAGELDAFAKATGPSSGRPGFTYSDLTQRVLPAAVLSVFPDKPLTAQAVLEVIGQSTPTPAFNDESTDAGSKKQASR